MSLTKLQLIYDTWYHVYKWQPKFEKETDSISFNLTFEGLTASLNEKLNPLKFKPNSSTIKNDKIEKIQIWKKKNLNINRGIALIKLTDKAQISDLNLFLKEIKSIIGKSVGYIPFLYELGLQIIIIGNDITIPSESPVDKVNTSKVILQSIFVIDSKKQEYYNSITWGQTVSAKFQKIINETIQEEINN